MFVWTSHRFSGGVLALDLINTIVWKDVEGQRTDRFADPANIRSFAKAATIHRAKELGGLSLVPPTKAEDAKNLLQLRARLDDWLRATSKPPSMHCLLEACAKASGQKLPGKTKRSLGEACSVSALRFLDADLKARVKVCPSCRWLYLDKSKNKSRLWCDMKVCGNRAKAQAHYTRMKIAREELHA
jgi:predicted RNA-binding Zn ribbon-like protein